MREVRGALLLAAVLAVFPACGGRGPSWAVGPSPAIERAAVAAPRFSRRYPRGAELEVPCRSVAGARFRVVARGGAEDDRTLLDVVHRGGGWVVHRLALPAGDGELLLDFAVLPPGRWGARLGGTPPADGRFGEPRSPAPVVGRSLDPRPNLLIVALPGAERGPGAERLLLARGGAEGRGAVDWRGEMSFRRGGGPAALVAAQALDPAAAGFDESRAPNREDDAAPVVEELLDEWGGRGPWTILVEARWLAGAPPPLRCAAPDGAGAAARAAAARRCAGWLLDDLLRAVDERGLRARTSVVVADAPAAVFAGRGAARGWAVRGAWRPIARGVGGSSAASGQEALGVRGSGAASGQEAPGVPGSGAASGQEALGAGGGAVSSARRAAERTPAAGS